MRRKKIAALMIGIILIGNSAIGFAGEQKQEGNKPATSCAAPLLIGDKATCPVLGNIVTIAKDTPHSFYNGRYYYFCCTGCKPLFDANPEKYIKKAQ